MNLTRANQVSSLCLILIHFLCLALEKSTLEIKLLIFKNQYAKVVIPYSSAMRGRASTEDICERMLIHKLQTPSAS